MSETRRESHGSGYEKRDVNVTRVALFTLIMLVILGLGGYFVPYFLFRHMAGEVQSQDEAPPLYQPDQLPPAPRLQTKGVRDLEALRAAEARLLGSYEWIDRDNGVVRIPIEQALDLTARRGLRQRPDMKEEAMFAADSSRKQP